MNKKVLVSSLLVLTTTFLLSGCSGVSKTEETYTFDNADYKNNSFPQWSESSVDFLKKDGWTINAPAGEFLSKYNVAIPTVFYAASPDNKCIIKYDISETPDTKANIDSYFLANQYLQNDTSVNYAKTKITSYNTEEIKVKDAGTVEMLDIKFDFVTSEQIEAFATEEEAANAAVPTLPGSGARLGRVFTNPVTNPYAAIYKEAPDVKVLPLVSITYSCNGTKISNSLWEQVVANAQLNFDPLPKVTGSPTIPADRTESGVPERNY